MISVCIATQVNWQDRPTFSLLRKCLESLKQIDDYEVIICGNIRELPFDHKAQLIYRSNEKLGAKNNILIKEAKGQHIVYMRDYMILAPGWYKGYQEFGGDWDLCMNKIQNPNGSRYRDWVQLCNPDNPPAHVQTDVPWPNGIKRAGKPYLADYKDTRTNTMYVSGGFFVAKKTFLDRYPFDDNLDFCQAEDIEWFDTFRDTDFSYKMNPLSITALQIRKDPIFSTKQ